MPPRSRPAPGPASGSRDARSATARESAGGTQPGANRSLRAVTSRPVIGSAARSAGVPFRRSCTVPTAVARPKSPSNSSRSRDSWISRPEAAMGTAGWSGSGLWESCRFVGSFQGGSSFLVKRRAMTSLATGREKPPSSLFNYDRDNLVRRRARLGHRPRGLLARRRRLGLLPPQPRPQPRRPLERGRPGMDDAGSTGPALARRDRHPGLEPGRLAASPAPHGNGPPEGVPDAQAEDRGPHSGSRARPIAARSARKSRSWRARDGSSVG
jgi:hypothetical protein